SLSIIYTMLPDGTFTFVSPSWKKFLGHEPSEVVGKNFRAFVHPDDIPMCEGFLKLIVESGGGRTNTGITASTTRTDRSTGTVPVSCRSLTRPGILPRLSATPSMSPIGNMPRM